MRRQGGLVERERPNPKIMDLDDSVYLHKRVFHLGILEPLGNSFHQDINNILNNRYGSENN